MERREKHVWCSLDKADLMDLGELFKLGPVTGLLWCRKDSTRGTVMHEIVSRDLLAATVLFANTAPPLFGRAIGEAKDASGCTALHVAAHKLRADHLKYLLPLPWVDIKAVDSVGRTLLHVFLRRLRGVRISHRRGEEGDDATTSSSDMRTRACLEVVQVAINRDPDMAAMRDKDGHSVLDYAISLGDAAVVAALVTAISPHLDWKALLKKAILTGRAALVSIFANEAAALWADGARSETSSVSGISATLAVRADMLCFAVESERPESLHSLLCCDFFRDAINVPAYTTAKRVVQVAVEMGTKLSDATLRTLLVKGARAVFQFSAPVSVQSSSSSGYDNAFALAAAQNNVDALRLLVLGASSSGVGKTAQALPCKGGFLMGSGPTSDAGDDDQPITLQSSPLCAAAATGQLGTLTFLLQQEALFADMLDWPDARTGRSPLDSACYSLHADCVAALLRAGTRLVARSPVRTDAASRQAYLDKAMASRKDVRAMFHVLEQRGDVRATQEHIKEIRREGELSAQRAAVVRTRMGSLRLRHLKHFGTFFHKLPAVWKRFLDGINDAVQRMPGSSKRMKDLEWSLSPRHGEMPPLLAAMFGVLDAFEGAFSADRFQAAATCVPGAALASLARVAENSKSSSLASAQEQHRPVLDAFRCWASVVCALVPQRQASVRLASYLEAKEAMQLQDAYRALCCELDAWLDAPLQVSPVNALSQALVDGVPLIRRPGVDEDRASQVMRELQRAQDQSSPDSNADAPFTGEVLKNVHRLGGEESNPLIPTSTTSIGKHWWHDALSRGQVHLLAHDVCMRDVALYSIDVELLVGELAGKRPDLAVLLLQRACPLGASGLLGLSRAALDASVRSTSLAGFMSSLLGSTLLLPDWDPTSSSNAITSPGRVPEDIDALLHTLRDMDHVTLTEQPDESLSLGERKSGLGEMLTALQAGCRGQRAGMLMRRAVLGGVLFLAVIPSSKRPQPLDDDHTRGSAGHDEADGDGRLRGLRGLRGDEGGRGDGDFFDRSDSDDESRDSVLLLCTSPNHAWEGLCFEVVGDGDGDGVRRARMLGVDGRALSLMHTGDRGLCRSSDDSSTSTGPGDSLQWDDGGFSSSPLDRFLAFPSFPGDVGAGALEDTLQCIMGGADSYVSPRTFQKLMDAMDTRSNASCGDLVFSSRCAARIYMWGTRASTVLARAGKTDFLKVLLTSCRKATPDARGGAGSRIGDARDVRVSRLSEKQRIDVNAAAVATQVEAEAVRRSERARRRFEQLRDAATGPDAASAGPCLASLLELGAVVAKLWTSFVPALELIPDLAMDRAQPQPMMHLGDYLISESDAELVSEAVFKLEDVAGGENSFASSAFLEALLRAPVTTGKELVVHSIKKPAPTPAKPVPARGRTPAQVRRARIQDFQGFAAGAERFLGGGCRMCGVDLKDFNALLCRLLAALHSLEYEGDTTATSTSELPPARALLQCVERWTALGLMQSHWGDGRGDGDGGTAKAEKAAKADLLNSYAAGALIGVSSWHGSADAIVSDVLRCPAALVSASQLRRTVKSNCTLYARVLGSRPFVGMSDASVVDPWVPAEALPVMCLDLGAVGTFWDVVKLKIEALEHGDSVLDHVIDSVEALASSARKDFGYGSASAERDEPLPECMYLSLAAKAASVVMGISLAELKVLSTVDIMVGLMEHAVTGPVTGRARLRLQTMFELLDGESEELYAKRAFYQEHSYKHRGLNTTGLHVCLFIRASSLLGHSEKTQMLLQRMTLPRREASSPHSSSALLHAAVASDSIHTTFAVLQDYLRCRFGDDYMHSQAHATVRSSLRVYVNFASEDMGVDTPPLAVLAAAQPSATRILALLVRGAVALPDGSTLELIPWDDSSDGRPILDVSPCGRDGWSVLHSALTCSAIPLYCTASGTVNRTDSAGDSNSNIDTAAPAAVAAMATVTDDHPSLKDVQYSWQAPLFTGRDADDSPSQRKDSAAVRMARRQCAAETVAYLLSDSCSLHMPACFQHAATIPMLLDVAACHGQWQTLEVLLDRGALASLGANPLFTRETRYNFAHEAALLGRASLFAHIKFVTAGGNEALLKNILFSFRHAVYTRSHAVCVWPIQTLPEVHVEDSTAAIQAHATHSLLHDAIYGGHEGLALELIGLITESFTTAVAGKLALGFPAERFWHFQDTALLNYAAFEGMAQVAAALVRAPFNLNPKAVTPVPFMQLQRVLIDPVQLCLYRANDVVLRAILMGDAGSSSLDMTPSAVTNKLQDHFSSHDQVARLVSGAIAQGSDAVATMLVRVWRGMEREERENRATDHEQRRRSLVTGWRAAMAAARSKYTVQLEAVERVAEGDRLRVQNSPGAGVRVRGDDLLHRLGSAASVMPRTWVEVVGMWEEEWDAAEAAEAAAAAFVAGRAVAVDVLGGSFHTACSDGSSGGGSGGGGADAGGEPGGWFSPDNADRSKSSKGGSEEWFSPDAKVPLAAALASASAPVDVDVSAEVEWHELSDANNISTNKSKSSMISASAGVVDDSTDWHEPGATEESRDTDAQGRFFVVLRTRDGSRKTVFL